MRTTIPNRRLNQSLSLTIGRAEVHFTFGYGIDRELLEVFIDAHKTGTDLREMVETTAKLVSVALQHGTPLPVVIDILRDTQRHSVGDALAKLLSDPTIARLP